MVKSSKIRAYLKGDNAMKVLVVGKGGREHAIADAVARSGLVSEIYTAPGNVGMEDISTRVNISAGDVEKLCAFAKAEEIDLTIVGPEDTLALGIVDVFEKEVLKIWGPTKSAARVESSKDFAKAIMAKHNIPTAAYATFKTYAEAKAYVEANGAPIVIKEDGLKAGKGVTVAQTVEEAIEALDIAFAIENNSVVIEECLFGFEFSLMTFVSGEVVIPMEIAQDHKCAYDGDTGPNTGGMGVYSPVKKITPEIIEEAMEKVMKPMAKAMVEEGCPFTGFLYGGLMLTKDGVKTIEFNARFGDPEAEVILPRLKSDFVQVILDVLDGKTPTLEWDDKVTLGVVMASEGYPASSTKNAVIENVDAVESRIFHMGTDLKEDKLVTDGGRVLIVVASADTIEEAYEKAYKKRTLP